MATNITQNLEGITKQLLDNNRNYINKSIDAIGKLKNSPTQKITNINQDLIADVFNGIVKLNLDYYSKLIDYGFSVTNKILSAPENRLGENEEQGSSFTLAGKGNAGSSIDISFVLDNSKSEKAFCQLENTPFVSIDEHKENPDITVSFQPQSFDLEAGKSESISVLCSVSEKSAAGTFYSYARVIGFEPAYFTIVLTIEQNTKQDAINTQPAKKTTAKK